MMWKMHWAFLITSLREGAVKDLWRLSHFSQFTNPNPNSNSTHTCIHTRTHTDARAADTDTIYTNEFSPFTCCLHIHCGKLNTLFTVFWFHLKNLFYNLLSFISQFCLLHHLLLFFLLYVFGYVCVCVCGVFGVSILCFSFVLFYLDRRVALSITFSAAVSLAHCFFCLLFVPCFVLAAENFVQLSSFSPTLS